MKTWYSVHIETEGPEVREERLDGLIAALDAMRGVEGPVISWRDGPGAVLSVQAPNPAAAARKAIVAFEQALRQTGLEAIPVRVDAMTEEYRDAWLEEPPSGFMGVTEIARALGVSKQRVSELRRRQDFPRPVAELAAGPVWSELSLGHFLREWDRKPGRPRKAV